MLKNYLALLIINNKAATNALIVGHDWFIVPMLFLVLAKMVISRHS
jgi:hypothetical protein